MQTPTRADSYAGDLLMAGLFNRLEIWDETKWKEYKEKTEKATDQIAKHMADLGV